MYIFYVCTMALTQCFHSVMLLYALATFRMGKTIVARATVYPCLYMMSYTHKRMHPVQVVMSVGLKCECVCEGGGGGGGVAQLVVCCTRKPDAILMRVWVLSGVKDFSSRVNLCADSLTIQHNNTIRLYCLCVEKFAFWLVIYVKHSKPFYCCAVAYFSICVHVQSLKLWQPYCCLDMKTLHTLVGVCWPLLLRLLWP